MVMILVKLIGEKLEDDDGPVDRDDINAVESAVEEEEARAAEDTI